MSKNNADLLRTRLRELRQTLSVAERQHDSTALCARLQAWFDQRLALNDVSQQSRPLIVAGFWPLEYEPDLRPLLYQLDQNQVTVCLPVIVERHAPQAEHIAVKGHGFFQVGNAVAGVEEFGDHWFGL